MLRVSKVVPPKASNHQGTSPSVSFPARRFGPARPETPSGKSTRAAHHGGRGPRNTTAKVQHEPNIRIGYLEQEPKLNPDSTVREEVEAALGEVMQAQKKLDEV